MNEKTRKTIERIVLGLGFETVETRNSDRLDFRELSVSAVVEALEAAHKAGARSVDPAAVLGRKGGSVTSEAKAAAVRENGKKGGRPRTEPSK